MKTIFIALLSMNLAATAAFGSTKASSVRELAHSILTKSGREVSQDRVGLIANRISKAARKHGDEALDAIRRTGPRGLNAIEAAGDQAPATIRLMIKHGDQALWVVERPNRLAIFVKYGDDAATAMIRHGEFTEQLIKQGGQPAASALAKLSPHNARRLKLLADDQLSGQHDRSSELMELIAKRGDPAMEFIWKHKGSLAIAATLTAFLADPGPFIDGTKDLASISAGAVGASLAAAVSSSGIRLLLALLSLAIIGIFVWRRK